MSGQPALSTMTLDIITARRPRRSNSRTAIAPVRLPLLLVSLLFVALQALTVPATPAISTALPVQPPTGRRGKAQPPRSSPAQPPAPAPADTTSAPADAIPLQELVARLEELTRLRRDVEQRQTE